MKRAALLLEKCPQLKTQAEISGVFNDFEALCELLRTNSTPTTKLILSGDAHLMPSISMITTPTNVNRRQYQR